MVSRVCHQLHELARPIFWALMHKGAAEVAYTSCVLCTHYVSIIPHDCCRRCVWPDAQPCLQLRILDSREHGNVIVADRGDYSGPRCEGDCGREELDGWETGGKLLDREGGAGLSGGGEGKKLGVEV